MVSDLGVNPYELPTMSTPGLDGRAFHNRRYRHHTCHNPRTSLSGQKRFVTSWRHPTRLYAPRVCEKGFNIRNQCRCAVHRTIASTEMPISLIVPAGYHCSQRRSCPWTCASICVCYLHTNNWSIGCVASNSFLSMLWVWQLNSRVRNLKQQIDRPVAFYSALASDRAFFTVISFVLRLREELAVLNKSILHRNAINVVDNNCIFWRLQWRKTHSANRSGQDGQHTILQTL